ncbi:MAG: LamG domain-containing protein [Kiritimatiellia bacterium]
MRSRVVNGLIALCLLCAYSVYAVESEYAAAVSNSQPSVYFRLSEHSETNFYSDLGNYTGVVFPSLTSTGDCRTVNGPRYTEIFDGVAFDGFGLYNYGLVFFNSESPDFYNARAYMTVEDSMQLNPGTGSFTIEGWIRCARSGTQKYPEAVCGKMGYNDGTSFISYRYGYYIAVHNGEVFARIIDKDAEWSEAKLETPKVPVDRLKWYHVVAVFTRNPPGTDDEASIFVNGEHRGTTYSPDLKSGNAIGGATQDIQPPGPFGIGGVSYEDSSISPGMGFYGRIDEVALYQRALSAAEIKQHWDAADSLSIVYRDGDLPVTDNLVINLQNDSVVTNSAGDIALWLDCAPEGGRQDFLQRDKSRRPSFKDDGMIGASEPSAVAAFSKDENDYLSIEAAACLNTNTLTWFMVLKYDDVSVSGYSLRSEYNIGGAVWGNFLSADKEVALHSRTEEGAFARYPFLPENSSQWFVMAGIWNGSADTVNGHAGKTLRGRLMGYRNVSYSAYEDGFFEGRENNAGLVVNSHSVTYLGAENGYNSTDGQIAGLVVYDTALSDSDVDSVMNHLYARYFSSPVKGTLILVH